MTKDQNYKYTWDAANRLVSLTFINPQPTTMTDNITFIYDGLGRRVGIVESHGSNVLTSKAFVWCGKKLCQERDSTGHTVTKQFFTYGEQINGTNYYFAKDHVGSVRDMTDSGGNIQASYDYDAWGRQTQLAGSLTADFGYTGFYINRTTGLGLTWYRAYDTEKGRWLSRDPLENQIDFNRYEYVANDPIKLIDPNGLLYTDDPNADQNLQDIVVIAIIVVLQRVDPPLAAKLAADLGQYETDVDILKTLKEEGKEDCEATQTLIKLYSTLVFNLYLDIERIMLIGDQSTIPPNLSYPPGTIGNLK
jgi:RHS repeat-associated protein